MFKFDKIVFGNNVKLLRKAIGVSQLDFAILIDISKRSVANIEAGITSNNMEVVSKICSFYNIGINDLNDLNYKIPDDFRDKIIKHHKNNIIYFNIINKQPKIFFSIEKNLLNSTFLDKPKEINEIKLFFEKMGINYRSSSLSNALKGNKNIKIDTHPNKKGTFIYSKLKIGGELL